ncbi:unnamed protein product, partial [Staurois parvus]
MNRPHHWCSSWRNTSPIIGISGRNSCLIIGSSVGGIVPHHWCQWEEYCPIIGNVGRNSCPIIGVSGRISVPSLVVGGRNSCPIIGVSGEDSAPSLVSLGEYCPNIGVLVGGLVPHHWYQCGEI